MMNFSEKEGRPTALQVVVGYQSDHPEGDAGEPAAHGADERDAKEVTEIVEKTTGEVDGVEIHDG